MVSSLARTALALLCAVSLIYGTALFPAAFDVELATTDPDAPSGIDPPDDPADDPGSNDGAPSTNGDDTATATATPSPTPASSGGDGGDDSGGAEAGGGFDFVVGFVVLGLLVLAVAALRDASFDGSGGWSLPSFGGLSLPNVPAVGGWLQRIPQLTTWLLVSGGAGLAGVFDDLAAVGRGVATSLADAAGPSRSLLGSLVLSGPRALATAAVAPFAALSRAGSLVAGLSFLGGGLSGTRLLGSDPPADDARANAPVDPAPGDDEAEPVPSVIAAWEAMTSLISVRNPDATTPAEYARRAVDAGFPADPVRRLTALFREVRYGGRPESEERLTLARRALDAVKGGEDR